MKTTNLSDVERTLINARELQDFWVDQGWDFIELEEETMSNEILDIYPLVEVDISVTITIKLPNKVFVVPLKDVTPLSVNDCLIIGVSDLYSDWENRILNSLGQIVYETTTMINDVKWIESKYLGTDSNFRIIRLKAD